MFVCFQLNGLIPIFLSSRHTGIKLYSNETMKIPFTVENTGSVKQDIDVEISDDKLFAQLPLRVSFSIGAGKNESGNFTLLGGSVLGETTYVLTYTH